MLIFPNTKQYPVLVKSQFGYTNNTTEFEACILVLEVALEQNIRKIDMYGDSILIITKRKENGKPGMRS